MPNKKHPESFFAPRPYSMFVGGHLRTNNGELSHHVSASGSAFSSPSRSPNMSAVKDLKKTKRTSSSADLRNSNESLGYASNSSDLDYNVSTELSHSLQKKKNKKRNSTTANNKPTMPPPGPGAHTWLDPKAIKKLSINGNVFGVHLSKSGTCYVSVVTEKGDRLIQAFDRNGSLSKSFPAQVTKAGKPFEPYQIHETPDGCLAVASGTCVTVWTKEGKLVTEHGRNMFKFAKSIAVRSTGEIIVTDTDNKAVKVISASGQQIYKLEGDFSCPVGVAVDSNDNVIVSDWSDKISIFDAENELVQTFGVKGNNPGELDLPYGVSVDSENNIVVADMWNHRLSVYNQQGQFLNHIVCAPGQLVRMPAHVSVATGLAPDDYRLAVTDFAANSVRVFTY